MPKGGWRDNQVWFPGSHCDVGGGYEKHDLSDFALFWMVGEIKSFINIDTSFLVGDLKRFIQPQTRLQGGAIKPGMVFHESILYAPTTLTRPQYMLTLDTLKQAFGTSWKPTIAPLNEISGGNSPNARTNRNHGIFEKVPESVTFESVSDLFP
ncbi:hypothetical protein F5J12DRAFT_851196 [Pisolithus orientalis]|uniref:uncharacterized protein n=1 Tax=Pisolithus orientalis TaxID=936130 RepID=UPI0022245299|nr:uncharacterized protein F5J12DRAFT_851196 [Pisolithus orientalis]KAI5997682.1 hypothetical protein F5J12DRAFT_851196 [Pisolithus orientalis]